MASDIVAPDGRPAELCQARRIHNILSPAYIRDDFTREFFSIRQYAALPYRNGPGGVRQILLITSRDTRRWVIPKGNPIRGLAAHEAAAHEAFEEAGLAGTVDPVSLGSYGYGKRRRSGRVHAMRVEVFSLAVEGQHDDWPEQGKRDLRWFSQAAAAAAVDEPELRTLISTFGQPRETVPVGRRLIDGLLSLLPGFPRAVRRA